MNWMFTSLGSSWPVSVIRQRFCVTECHPPIQHGWAMLNRKPLEFSTHSRWLAMKLYSTIQIQFPSTTWTLLDISVMNSPTKKKKKKSQDFTPQKTHKAAILGSFGPFLVVLQRGTREPEIWSDSYQISATCIREMGDSKLRRSWVVVTICRWSISPVFALIHCYYLQVFFCWCGNRRWLFACHGVAAPADYGARHLFCSGRRTTGPQNNLQEVIMFYDF